MPKGMYLVHSELRLAPGIDRAPEAASHAGGHSWFRRPSQEEKMANEDKDRNQDQGPQGNEERGGRRRRSTGGAGRRGSGGNRGGGSQSR